MRIVCGGGIGAEIFVFLWGRFPGGKKLERKWWGWHFLAGKNQVGVLVGRENIETGVK